MLFSARRGLSMFIILIKINGTYIYEELNPENNMLQWISKRIHEHVVKINILNTAYADQEIYIDIHAFSEDDIIIIPR